MITSKYFTNKRYIFPKLQKSAPVYTFCWFYTSFVSTPWRRLYFKRNNPTFLSQNSPDCVKLQSNLRNTNFFLKKYLFENCFSIMLYSFPIQKKICVKLMKRNSYSTEIQQFLNHFYIFNENLGIDSFCKKLESKSLNLS